MHASGCFMSPLRVLELTCRGGMRDGGWGVGKALPVELVSPLLPLGVLAHLRRNSYVESSVENAEIKESTEENSRNDARKIPDTCKEKS